MKVPVNDRDFLCLHFNAFRFGIFCNCFSYPGQFFRFRFDDVHGLFARLDTLAQVPAVYFGKFCSEVKYDGRVVDPDKYYKDGSHSAVSGAQPGVADVQSDQEFAYDEEQRGKSGADNAVFPGDDRIR